MKVYITLFAATLAWVLAACASSGGQQTVLATEPPQSPTPSPTEVPKPVFFEYEYEIVDTRADCEPDLSTWSELLALSYGISDKAEADQAAEKAALVVLCTQGHLQERLSQRGAEGWKLITFETLTPGQYDLGIEYTYRLVWERQK